MKFPNALHFGLAALTVACVEMERVPTATEIQQWQALQPFVLQADSITGVYRNHDVDAVVFEYNSNVGDVTEFWRLLQEGARSAGWAQATDGAVQRDSRYQMFYRFKPKGELWFSSAEELRVAYQSGRVAVAYVQSDQDGDSKPVKASEGRFAEKHIWPRFFDLLSRPAG